MQTNCLHCKEKKYNCPYTSGKKIIPCLPSGVYYIIVLEIANRGPHKKATIKKKKLLLE